jgi:hypothetical protein
MIDKKLDRATTAELEAELELYADAGAITADEIKALTNNASRAGVIEALRESAGEPRELTEEDMKTNPEFAEQGLTVGQIVLSLKELTPELLEAQEKEKARIEAEQAEEARVKAEAEEKAKADQAAGQNANATQTKPMPRGAVRLSLSEQRRLASQRDGGMKTANSMVPQEQLFYKGQPVGSHDGKLYHDVVTHEATYRLSAAEFTTEVTAQQ